MIAGPEIARVIEEFENSYLEDNGEWTHITMTKKQQVYNHVLQKCLPSDKSHCGNPFQEESLDLLVLDTKEIPDPAVLNTACNQVCNALHVGQDQFDASQKNV